MFNSFLLSEVSKTYSGRLDPYFAPLMRACRELHLSIIRTEIEMWKDQGGSGEEFISRFESNFPPGFIRRDLKRAQCIIFDLFDIASSYTVRYELTPIYTFVMFRLIEDWFEAYEGEEPILFVPEEIVAYLHQQNVSQTDCSSVKEWFTSHLCAEDFADTYNADYTNIHFIEDIADIYLNDRSYPAKFSLLQVSIDEFFDLLPTDLRELCIKKYEREKHMMFFPSLAHQQCSPSVFISYSWDSADHKQWVRTLSSQLIHSGIHVILDQNDLMLGDPLPHFMEQSISESDYVLIICTPHYKQKSDARKGGVGYEESIITGDVFTTQNQRKYVPVLAAGTWETSTPIWAIGKFGVDLSPHQCYEEELDKLIAHITG